MLKKTGKRVEDIDLFEINEAFQRLHWHAKNSWTGSAENECERRGSRDWSPDWSKRNTYYIDLDPCTQTKRRRDRHCGDLQRRGQGDAIMIKVD